MVDPSATNLGFDIVIAVKGQPVVGTSLYKIT
jgi:hypothetical protein